MSTDNSSKIDLAKLKQRSRWERSNLPFAIFVGLSLFLLVIAYKIHQMGARYLEDPERFDALAALNASQAFTASLFLGILGAAMICFTILFRFRFAQDSRILVALVERVEALEQERADKDKAASGDKQDSPNPQ